MAIKVACIQTHSLGVVEDNIAAITPMVREAAAAGAKLIALPENAFLMAVGEAAGKQYYPLDSHPALLAMQALAKELSVEILMGSLICQEPSAKKATNTAVLIDTNGALAARYDKIHLFDVTLPNGESHKESARMAHGGKAVLAQTVAGRLGMSICYDVRFPQLYRALAKAGAEILSVPAAFTHYTGSQAWHVLNRARAIENGCFVIAPAQCGVHEAAANRHTYGHALIIDPNGKVLAEASEDTPEIIYADIDLSEVTKARQTVPSLTHDREFTQP